MTEYDIILGIMVFVYGIIIGSFLNVCIFRIPKHEGIGLTRSHCMKCGYTLKWYDLIPVFSYLMLKGRCRKCGEKISLQYPAVELLNGILYVTIFLANGMQLVTILYCLLVSALIVLSFIDFRTYEIPFGINVFIFCLGVIRVITDYRQWHIYVIGFFAVSAFLYLLFKLSGGTAIGGGDVRLMAAAGLLIGWKLILLAFIAGCILGSVIHLIRMWVSGEGHTLAMGPYLAAGIYIAIMFGGYFLEWYMGGMLARI